MIFVRVLILSVMCIFLFSHCSQTETRVEINSTKDKSEKLVFLLCGLEPWHAFRDLTREEWDYYIFVAQKAQEEEYSRVELAFITFMNTCDFTKGKDESELDFEPESCLFLLMRVIFELPEDAHYTQQRSFYGWMNWPRETDEGRVNLSWPVTWSSGYPSLLDNYRGSIGFPYTPALEYKYLFENYAYRDLQGY